MNLHRMIFTAGLILAGIAAPVTASPTSVSFEGVTPGIGSAGQYNWNTGSTNYEGMVYTPFGNGSSSANHFVTFCIERNQFISGGSTYGGYHFSTLGGSPVPGPAMSSSTADALRAMWAEFRDDLDVGPDQAARSAAFQEAVWHLMDSNYNPSPSMSANTDYYSTYLNSANWHSGLANLAAIVNGNQQDQIFQLKQGYTVINGEITATPEPTTLVIGLLVAPALYLRRRFAAQVA